MLPDMSDENFAGNSSGVVLAYKLLSFENHAKDKERYFEKGLLGRFKIYDLMQIKVKRADIMPATRNTPKLRSTDKDNRVDSAKKEEYRPYSDKEIC